jgi:hypothetical protein
VKEQDFHWAEASFSFKQFGQYHGAGVLTGFGLRFRHLAQRKRLPFTAVFGRAFFPLLKMFFAIGASLSRQLPDELCRTLNPVLQRLIDFDAFPAS